MLAPFTRNQIIVNFKISSERFTQIQSSREQGILAFYFFGFVFTNYIDSSVVFRSERCTDYIRRAKHVWCQLFTSENKR